jgi:hypothetical protein
MLILMNLNSIIASGAIGANTTGAFSDSTDTDSTASGAVGVTPGSTALVITSY